MSEFLVSPEAHLVAVALVAMLLVYAIGRSVE